MNKPLASRATAATAAVFEFFDNASSTLIFYTPIGGGSHAGIVVLPDYFVTGIGPVISNSATNLSTKQ